MMACPRCYGKRYVPDTATVHGFLRCPACNPLFVDMTDAPKLKERILALESEVRHWKSNHANQVARTGLLTQRPDMPVDRLPAYERSIKLEADVASLEARNKMLALALHEACYGKLPVSAEQLSALARMELGQRLLRVWEEGEAVRWSWTDGSAALWWDKLGKEAEDQ